MKGKKSFRQFISGSVLLFLTFSSALAQIPLNKAENISLIGDIRFGYFSQMGEQRDGSNLNVHELRLRNRIGLRYTINQELFVQVRYAIRMNSRDIRLSPHIHTSAPGNNGLRMGEGAFDEAYIDYSPYNWFGLRAGRFQTGYMVSGVISNAIIRHDSPNTDIAWTDGLLLKINPADLWSADVILQYHHLNPPTNVFRSPINITQDDTPITLFTSIRRTYEGTPLDFIGMDFTYTPDALLKNSSGDRTDYIAASIKSRFTWNLDSDRQVLLGGELSYSFNRPEMDMVGFTRSDGEKAGGFGFQSNLSFMNLFENHHLGFIAAILEPSLLTSADFWSNVLLIEVRHQYVFNSRLSAETRLRYRGDHKKLDVAVNKRWQIFPYARFTYRFR
jgi:hypothetical protein